MAKKNTESLISENKVFTSGSGVKFRYDFVPALANKVFSEYITLGSEVAPKLLEHNRLLQDKKVRRELIKDKEKMAEYNNVSEELKEQAEYANDLGMKIIMMILERNPQTIEVTEDNVLLEMDVTDMNKFITLCCTATSTQKKR